MVNSTLKYEFEFIHYLDGKKFSEFPSKWQKHLKRMFPQIQDETIVHCSKHENYFAKGDIDVRIKGDKKIISLKNGRNACMHRERFTTLYYALKDLGLSRETMNVLTLYHFGECKAFGHYDKPLTKEEIATYYAPLILRANKELNQERILNFIIQRAIVLGRQEHRQRIDYLYYGNLEKGMLISTNQIIELVKSRKELSSSWLQFGQLVYQPAARNRETNDYLDAAIHWPVLSKLFNINKDEDKVTDYNVD